MSVGHCKCTLNLNAHTWCTAHFDACSEIDGIAVAEKGATV